MESPDTSLVRRNQKEKEGKGRGGVETPDTSLVRRNQVVWRLLTRLWSEATKGAERQKEGRRGSGNL